MHTRVTRPDSVFVVGHCVTAAHYVHRSGRFDTDGQRTPRQHRATPFRADRVTTKNRLCGRVC